MFGYCWINPTFLRSAPLNGALVKQEKSTKLESFSLRKKKNLQHNEMSCSSFMFVLAWNKFCIGRKLHSDIVVNEKLLQNSPHSKGRSPCAKLVISTLGRRWSRAIKKDFHSRTKDFEQSYLLAIIACKQFGSLIFCVSSFRSRWDEAGSL